ncbi:MAG: helicase-exonuclease AddAB subunit AddA, partial [Clostridia bacterium]|nr:helicase-exonuclease AddAB subunit AddA [Clostridia bacterium]
AQTEELTEERIDLHKNFRSRENVLHTVNDIFTRIMRKEVGGITYDESSALHYGLDHIETKGGLLDQTEYLILKRDSKTEDKVMLEAKMVATRIKKLLAEMIWDTKTQQSRTVKYQDIVILLRATGGNDEIFRRVLEEAGIPVHIASKTGYFETPEVETVLNYLQILDNPLQDIPLTASLKGVFGKFTDEELARIRCADRKRTMYHALISYAQKDELKEKIDGFLSQFQSFRKRIPYTSVYYLMEQLLRETGYFYYVRALPNGEKRYANVRMLLEKAESYGKTSYKGLFHFIRYIGYLKKYDVNYGEANTISENDNAVRIMSIHKSKGLEFPICFLSMTGKNINFMDSRQAIGYDMEYGIGVDHVDWKRRIKTPTLLKKLIQAKEKKETIAEELRVLYVALTRAKEKLIITGVIDDIDQRLQTYVMLRHDETSKNLPVSVITAFTSYADMILSAMIGHSNVRQVMLSRDLIPLEEVGIYQTNLKLEIMELTDLVEIEMQDTLMQEALHSHLMWLISHPTDTERIKQLFSYTYPFDGTAHIKMKVSVSELKEEHMNDAVEESEMLFAPEEIVPYVPRFISKKEDISAVARGTVYHKLMEIMDYQLSVDEMLLIPEYQELLKVVRVNDLQNFKQSRLAKRMEQAAANKQLYREQPFVLGLPANTVYPEASDQETILIQGIIDAYFIEQENVIVVDYKTDRVTSKAELILRYQTQLDHYATALCQLTGLKVSEKIIYSFALHKEIVLL